VAYLDGRLYIIQGTSKSITVFGVETNCCSEIDDECFERLRDIVACCKMSMLYILDQSCIWQLDKNGNITQYVPLYSRVSATMSIRERNLLVTSSKTLIKYVYKFWKRSPAEIRLPEGMSLAKLWHAVEVDGGHVIAHTDNAQFHRVSKIEASKRTGANVEVRAYVEEGVDRLSNPVYLALEPKHGHIFVADHENRRVVGLDRELKKVLMISDLPQGRYPNYPNRLCYVEERSELVIGMSDGLVIGYKFTR